MRYLGGKKRFAAQLIQAMQPTPEDTFVEPFCGGCAVIQRVPCHRRIANDIHPNLISLLEAVSQGWQPPSTLSLEEWRALRERARNGEVAPEIGFAGFGCSYGSRWFEGYARSQRGNPESTIPRSAAQSLVREAPLLAGIEFHCGPYTDLDIPPGSIIYLDPPYQDTKGYSGTAKFDHETFYAWCDIMAESCTLYLSEQTAPPHWRCIWEHSRLTRLDQDGERKPVMERLWTL